MLNTVLSNYLIKVKDFDISEALLSFDYLISGSTIEEAGFSKLASLYKSLNSLYVLLELSVDGKIFTNKSVEFVEEKKGKFISQYMEARRNSIESNFPKSVELIDSLKLKI